MNRCGGTRSRALCDGVTLVTYYVPGKLNILTDAESRALPSTGDWRLCVDAFTCIADLWPVDIDLFAASWNAQLSLFAAWTPQPGAVFVNAFSISWKAVMGYASPPFALIPRCLAKRERGIDLVLPVLARFGRFGSLEQFSIVIDT